MPLPPVATIAACGSILTACKSAWELSRMIKKKEQEKRLDSSARSVIYDLRRMYLDGLMDQKTFEKWYDRLLGALAEKDGPELQKIRAHLGLIQRDKSHILRRATHANAYSEEKHGHRHHRARSMDGRRSTRGPPPVYTVEEYEEVKSRRPSHIDTAKAQRDHYYAHALPSPHNGEIEYTPTTDEDSSSSKKSDRRGRGHGRHRHGGSSGGSSRATHRSESKSTTTGDRDRGRTRSRSVHTERRVSETEEDDDDADSEGEAYYDRRRRMSSAAYHASSGRGKR